MPLMTELQSECVLDHDETKSPASPSKRSAADTTDTPANKRNCAGPISLDAAMRAECRRRLYVHPIAWTPHHMQLLGVRFEGTKPRSREGMDDSRAGSDANSESAPVTVFPWNNEDSLRAIECLGGWSAELRRIAMADLLRSYALTRTGSWDRIEMQFRGQTVCHLRVQGVWTAKTGDRMMISTNFDAISELRHKWVQGGKGRTGRNYGAGLAVRRKKEKALQPTSAHLDPYIGGLLIALAQAHRRLAPDAPRWRVLLLAVRGPGARKIYCYQASVPSPLLQRLDEPSAEVACPDVVIHVWKIHLAKPRDAARRVWELLHEEELV